MKTAVQIVAHVNAKDAIGRMALKLHQLLRAQGVSSTIFTERKQSFGIGRLRVGPFRAGLLETNVAQKPIAQGFEWAFYHHSIGSHCADRFLEWPSAKKVLIYHNITPPHLVREELKKDCAWGVEQLPRLIAASHYQIGLSSFTCADLRTAGAKNVIHLPYLLETDLLPPSIGSDRLLMIGRVEPHKGVREAIRALPKIREKRPHATLEIVGNFSENSQYGIELRSLIQTLSLQNAVRLHGRVRAGRLARFYREAGALLCLSQHEGFCVPLVEAMRHQLPIVALRSSAISETLGQGGVLIESTDPSQVAAALDLALSDRPGPKQIEELKRFSDTGWRNFLR